MKEKLMILRNFTPSVLSKRLGSLSLLLVLSTASSVQAQTSTFGGNFSQDDNVQLFNFSVSGAAPVTLFTTSYAGGGNADGTTAPPGGFAPILTVYDGFGSFIADTQMGNTVVPPDPVTGQQYDAYLQQSFDPGTYTLALTEFDNTAAGVSLSEGFLRDGTGNFTGPEFLGRPGSFIDFTGSQRTSAWTVNFQNAGAAAPAAVPEASTGISLGLGLLALTVAGAVRRRKLRLTPATSN